MLEITGGKTGSRLRDEVGRDSLYWLQGKGKVERSQMQDVWDFYFVNPHKISLQTGNQLLFFSFNFHYEAIVFSAAMFFPLIRKIFMRKFPVVLIRQQITTILLLQ